MKARHWLGHIDICCLLSCLNIKKNMHVRSSNRFSDDRCKKEREGGKKF